MRNRNLTTWNFHSKRLLPGALACRSPTSDSGKALRTQSVRDALTGLYNQRYLEETLEREIQRAARGDLSLGFLMLDLDRFRNFKDTYGHEAGDVVLRETAACLVKNVRAEDFGCRFGGEEFAVILATAAVDGARARAERLRSKLKELTVLHQGRSWA
jgi:diguanylate cyclase (GGDEF)-like protein